MSTWSFRNISGLLLIVMIPLMLSTCGKENPSKPTGPVDPVTTPVPGKITIRPSSVSITHGQTTRLTAEVYDRSNNVMPGAVVTWASSDTTIAVVDASGSVTGRAGGSASITARTGSISGTATVKVGMLGPTSIAVTPSSIVLTSLGQTRRLVAVVRDQRSLEMTGVELTWSSSIPQVASVDTTGLVTALREGTVKVTARAGEATGTATVMVMQKAHAIILTPIKSSQLVGDTLRIDAKVTDAAGVSIPAPAITWSSSDESVAVVDTSGLATAVGIGTAKIYARVDGQENFTSITVYDESDRFPKTVSIVSSGTLSTVGDTVQLFVEVKDQTGRQMSEFSVRWSMSNWCVARVGSKSGIAEAVGIGKSKVFAEVSVAGRIFIPEITFTITSDTALSDREVLEDLYINTNGPDWVDNSGWSSDQPLDSWYGVRANDCDHVIRMDLSHNNLEGEIPSTLQYLKRLGVLDLEGNSLRGAIPQELGMIENLVDLKLGDNPALTGVLPYTITNLRALRVLTLGGTMVCAPSTSEFENWIQGLDFRTTTIPRCALHPSVEIYLTQAVQSLTYPVPLVAGEPALLRVFLTSNDTATRRMPPLRADFFVDGTPVHSVDVQGDASKLVPQEADESLLSSSINVVVPGHVIMPELEMAIVIDPQGTEGVYGNTGTRIPDTGSQYVVVREVPPLDLTVVPFVWTEDSDMSIASEVEGMTGDDEILWQTRDLLPVQSLNLTVRDFLWTSLLPDFNNSNELLRELTAARVSDGSGGHYIGILRGSGGRSDIPGTASVSGLIGQTMAHELGHNLFLDHAPCNGPLALDPRFPNDDGSIGQWGYNFRTGQLVAPETPDIMGYCNNGWISGYHFSKAVRFRISDRYRQLVQAPVTAAGRSLLVWGGIDGYGDLVLEPTFPIDSGSVMPEIPGPYSLVGSDRDGRTLFTLGFTMNRFSESMGAAFAFALPMHPLWTGRLSEITLIGPEKTVTIRDGDRRPMAILMDDQTGQMRGFLRNLTNTQPNTQTVQRMLPGSGLEFTVSGGIPDVTEW